LATSDLKEGNKMEKLSQTLRSHIVGLGETDTKDKVLVASFQVFDKNGIVQFHDAYPLYETSLISK
jgi:hypothetical protein